MKVSVLIPTYNSGQYLEECLESVLNQDFKDIEILISDNCSNDDTIKLIENFAAREGRIRWWQNPTNLGALANHNILLRAAQGEYIKFVHSDDKLFTPSALVKMAAAMDDNPAVSLVGTASVLIDENSRPRVDDRRDYLMAGVWEGKRVISASFEFEVAANYIGEPSLVMFRRSLALPGFHKDYSHSVDTGMWFHLLEQGNFAYLSEPLCAYRQHPAQGGQTNAGNPQNEIELMILLESYWVKPWVGGTATQRMLNSQIRFLKKNRAKFGPYAYRADKLIAQMEIKTNPVARTFFWLEHKTFRSFKRIRHAAIKRVLQRCSGN